jgi:hypothetical protein
VLNCPYDQRTERQTCNGLATSYTMSQDCGGMDSRLPGRGQVGIFFDGTDVAGGLASMDARHLSRWGRQGPPMLSVGFADGHAESVYYYNFDAIALSPPSAAH